MLRQNPLYLWTITHAYMKNFQAINSCLCYATIYQAIPWPRLQRRIWRRILACHLCPCDGSWVLHIVSAKIKQLEDRLQKSFCRRCTFAIGEWRIWWAAGGSTTHCNENPVYVFHFWELRGLSPNFLIHLSVSELYIPRIYTLHEHVRLQQNRQTDPGNIYTYLSQIYECRNWETEHYNSVLEIRRLPSFICGNT